MTRQLQRWNVSMQCIALKRVIRKKILYKKTSKYSSVLDFFEQLKHATAEELRGKKVVYHG